MIRYETAAGSRSRLDHGERARLVLAALMETPWQTQKQLGAHGAVLARLMKRGAIVRREGTGRGHSYEYATHEHAGQSA